MGILNKGVGSVKITKQEDGKYKASANGVDDFVANTESAAILGIQKNIEKAVELDESKQPFRIGH